MRKQIRGAMLALAAMAGIAGQAQSVRINAPLSVRQGKDMTQTPANAPAVRVNVGVPNRRVVPGGFHAGADLDGALEAWQSQQSQPARLPDGKALAARARND